MPSKRYAPRNVDRHSYVKTLNSTVPGHRQAGIEDNFVVEISYSGCH